MNSICTWGVYYNKYGNFFNCETSEGYNPSMTASRHLIGSDSLIMSLAHSINLKSHLNEQDKIYQMTCAPSKVSDLPGHLPSLIRVFAVCLKKVEVLGYP